MLYAQEVFAIRGHDLRSHRAQVQNYLGATGPKLGLLVNFGSALKARIERLVL
jgi:hypothetical protein